MNMIMFIHIAIALCSIVIGTLAFRMPERVSLMASYAGIAATFISGTLLVFAQPTQLTHACVSGIAYSIIMFALTVRAQRRLATQQARTK